MVLFTTGWFSSVVVLGACVFGSDALLFSVLGLNPPHLGKISLLFVIFHNDPVPFSFKSVLQYVLIFFQGKGWQRDHFKSIQFLKVPLYQIAYQYPMVEYSFTLYWILHLKSCKKCINFRENFCVCLDPFLATMCTPIRSAANAKVKCVYKPSQL